MFDVSSPRLQADLSRSSGGALFWLLWEILITLGDEVNLIWSKPNWSWVKWLYLIARYIPFCIHLCSRSLEAAVKYHYIRNNRPIRVWYASQVMLASFVATCLEIVLMARVYALYNRPRRLKYLFIVLVLAENGACLVGMLINLPPSDFDPSDLLLRLPTSFAFFGISALAVQLTIVGLTVFKYIRTPFKTVPLVKLMVRDGTFAFLSLSVFNIVVMSYTLCDIVFAVTGYAWLLSALSCVTCRLILNMTSLPVHQDARNSTDSNDVELSTIVSDMTHLDIDQILSSRSLPS